MKAAPTMKEIHSHAKMDVIPALALLDTSIVVKTHANQKLVSMKATHTMKEIHSVVKMDAILVLALLVKSIVPKPHVNLRIVNVTVIVILAFIVPNNPVMILNKVLALDCLRTV